MKRMSSKEIKDRYGDFVEAARRGPVVHTSHGRPTLVTISIDRARAILELQQEIDPDAAEERERKIARLFEIAGSGVPIGGQQSLEEMDARIRLIRGVDE